MSEIVALLLGGICGGLIGYGLGWERRSRADVWQEMRTPGRTPFAGPRAPLSESPHMRELMGDIERNRFVYFRGILPRVRSERP
jgi:hypothetical protein